MHLILIGMPGSGKSTQGNALSLKLGIPYISTGKTLRTIAEENTPRGERMREIMHVGDLLPDDQTIEIMEEHLSQPQFQKGYIVDGFPRTMYQVEHISFHIDKAILIELTDEEAIRRISTRLEKRNDGSIEATMKRLKIFHDETDKVIEYFEKKGMLIRVNGLQSIQEITEDILAKLT